MKTILITGAFGTIGKALVKELKGYKILRHDYRGRGDIGGDFSTDRGLEECALAVSGEPLYGIIHTVGPYYQKKLDSTSSLVWRELFQSNVVSAAFLASRLKPEVFLAFGVAGLEKGALLMPAYLAVKNALHSLIKSLALSGMRANLVCPGSVEGSKFVQKGPQVTEREVADLVELLLKSESITGQMIDIRHSIR